MLVPLGRDPLGTPDTYPRPTKRVTILPWKIPPLILETDNPHATLRASQLRRRFHPAPAAWNVIPAHTSCGPIAGYVAIGSVAVYDLYLSSAVPLATLTATLRSLGNVSMAPKDARLKSTSVKAVNQLATPHTSGYNRRERSLGCKYYLRAIASFGATRNLATLSNGQAACTGMLGHTPEMRQGILR